MWYFCWLINVVKLVFGVLIYQINDFFMGKERMMLILEVWGCGLNGFMYVLMQYFYR